MASLQKNIARSMGCQLASHCAPKRFQRGDPSRVKREVSRTTSARLSLPARRKKLPRNEMYLRPLLDLFPGEGVLFCQPPLPRQPVKSTKPTELQRKFYVDLPVSNNVKDHNSRESTTRSLQFSIGSVAKPVFLFYFPHPVE